MILIWDLICDLPITTVFAYLSSDDGIVNLKKEKFVLISFLNYVWYKT